MIFDKYPYTNFHEMNDDWVIQTLREFGKRLDEFVAANSLTYADPIAYDAATTYPANTVIIYDNAAYVSKQAIPAGMLPTNAAYWLLIFPFGDLIDQSVNEGMLEIVNILPSVVDTWMTNHPDITTTVQDGAIDWLKLHNNLQHVLLAGYSQSSTISINDFEQGAINIENGEEASSTFMCRTGFITFPKGITLIRTMQDLRIQVFQYALDGTFEYRAITVARIAFMPFVTDENHKYRISISYDDYSTLTPADLPLIPVVCSVYQSDYADAIKSAIAKFDDEYTYNDDVTFMIKNMQPADVDSNTGVAGQTIISAIANARCINKSNGKWVVAANAQSELIRIPAGANGVKIIGNSTNGTDVAMMTNNNVSPNQVAAFATGWNTAVNIPSGTTEVFDIPSDAVFMYLTNKGMDGSSNTPSYLAFQYTTEKNPSVKFDLEEKAILLSAFDQTRYSYVTTRYINYTNNYHLYTTWTTAPSPSKSVLIPIDGARKIQITANDTNEALFTFLRTKSTAIATPPYADGYAHTMAVNAGESLTVNVPNNANFLYLRLVEADSTDRTPTDIKAYVETNRVTKKRPLFCFIDDDARQVALDWLEQVVDATRIPINIALITSGVGLSQYSTWDNIRRLRNKGFVFVNHTNTFVPLTSMTEQEVIDTFETSQRIMEEHGLPDSNILVLPGGATNATVTGITENYFTFAASTQPGLNLPPINSFYLCRIDLDTYNGNDPEYVNKLDEWKGWVDKAISANGLCIFYSHAYHADYNTDKLADYIALVQYIAQKGGEIVSLPDALKIYGNNIEGDITVGCDEIII